ncbi:uncharacterized protein LOC110835775 isoform X3 [Zootermopsis nevadensis]|nr:uncharacterized protein LOC110835775 isoform X3 [Zootermopsis nevadensis]XP_021932028.1 uncharacterized protein LOC110835775 isoform X3 [Zootermopsis nevadensis]
MVLIKCPPEDQQLLSYCCNDNGKIVCCSEEDFIHREDGQSVEAVTLLAVSGFITILIVTILCYVRWHSRFLKSDSSEFSHTAKNLETVTAQQNEHQGTLPPQATFKRTIPSCRYAEVLKSILNEDKEEIFFPKKNDRK